MSNSMSRIHPSLAPDEGDSTPPPRDELDAILREWHNVNTARAQAGRDRLTAALKSGAADRSRTRVARASNKQDSARTWATAIRRLIMNRSVQLSVAAALLIAALPFFLNAPANRAMAKDASREVLCPDGGRLEARDSRGLTLGPCVLKHTDVHAVVQGHFTRVTVKQKYHNPHREKIEAIYTFPLSHRGAVDRMNMSIGDRVIIGQVRERDAAKQIYQSAKDAGRVASLLEQERPNIFTQSIANIDPGVDIDIEISYVETLESKDGVYSFSFPTVVSPRYIPGDTPSWLDDRRPSAAGAGDAPPRLPPGTVYRRGLVLSAPATITLAAPNLDPASDGAIDTLSLARSLSDAVPITPSDPDSTPSHGEEDPAPLLSFKATYPDGSSEYGTIHSDFTGQIGGRWFFLPQREMSIQPASPIPPSGEPFARPTSQVPDADRITPTPTRPPFRSGHDISITVDIDTGGAGLLELTSPLHSTTRQDAARRPDGLANRTRVTLSNDTEIPNRDFVLSWKQTRDTISDGVFTTSTRQGDYFAIILNPPERIADEQAVPRELVFVLDTSGSMNGTPIEKSKALAARMIETMRPKDTFNVITFAGRTSVLWPSPRPNTESNRREALAFFASKGGSGGTEMMSAINAALEQRTDGREVPITLEDLSNMPADGRVVTVGCTARSIERDEDGDLRLRVRLDLALRATGLDWTAGRSDSPLSIVGEWTTVAGDRVLRVRSVTVNADPPPSPLRIVVFLTDGEVGNEGAILDAIKRNRGTTRVFSYGIGNSVNRYLLAEAAKLGGGEAEFILLPNTAADDEARAAVDRQAEDAARRLHEKTRTPVLANISVEFSPSLSIADIEPAPGQIPDLYDVQPLVILGRFTRPGEGTVSIRGTTGAGRWERTLRLASPPRQPESDGPMASLGGDGVVATLWARARIDALMNSDLRATLHGTPPAEVRRRIVRLGENFGVMSRFTSFVAVDHQRVTIDGHPRLVRVPIELPDRTTLENYFAAEVLEQPVEKLSTMVQEVENLRKSARDEKTPGKVVYEPKQRAPLTTAAPVYPVEIGKVAGPDRGHRTTGSGQSPSAKPSAPGGALPPPIPPASPMPARQPRESSPATANPDAQSPPDNSGGREAATDERRKAEARLDQLTEVARQPHVGFPFSSTESDLSSRFGRSVGQSQSEREQAASVQLHLLLAAGDDAQDPVVSGDGSSRSPLPPPAGRHRSVASPDAVKASSELDIGTDLPHHPRLLPLAAARLIVASLRVGNTTSAVLLRDRFLPRYPDAALLREAASLIPGPAPAAEVTEARSASSRSAETDDLIRRIDDASRLELTLLKRLDPRLYALLPGNTPAASSAPAASESVLVSVLVADSSEPSMRALRQAGLKIKSTITNQPCVIGVVKLSDLESLAMTDGVRRIELIDD